jgi:hypothetical protein
VNKVVFEPLPPRAQGYTRHIEVAAQLRERPGQWARVSECSSGDSARTMVYRIRHAIVKAYAPAGAFEAEWRGSGRVRHVYARYVGEGS